ncbi:hypothetical protein thalar_02984 [Litoreibacter arenae DSM 19593]|uniref:Uncharacterized protein n=1 Tax=Litoreibacter arenae DSM 19593 TaxID=1123360 RepID=S9QBB9_9RHOB|nr:hypothetical protein thalar_02984 [Litoreibacter arenae DSM 19593]
MRAEVEINDQDVEGLLPQERFGVGLGMNELDLTPEPSNMISPELP